MAIKDTKDNDDEIHVRERLVKLETKVHEVNEERLIKLETRVQKVNDDELRFIGERLVKLETKFQERWDIHEKRFDEIWREIKDSLKDLSLKLQVAQERYLSQHELCMKEIDIKMKVEEAEMKKEIEMSESKIWKAGIWSISIILVAIPSLFYMIWQIVNVFLAISKKT